MYCYIINTHWLNIYCNLKDIYNIKTTNYFFNKISLQKAMFCIYMIYVKNALFN